MSERQARTRERKEQAMDGAELIAAERQRVGSKDWTAQPHAEPAAAGWKFPPLIRAALAYLRQDPRPWPWAADLYQPTPQDRVQELVRAGALIAAEIDRLQHDAGRDDLR